MGLSWLGILRLALVQTALGAIIVLTTSTLNRIMVVEFALPAMLPGFLVGVHHIIQLARPRIGHGSDVGGRRTPWILGGMVILAMSGVVAAAGTVTMESSVALGGLIAFIGYAGIGLGSGATGTSLLVLLAKEVDDARKPAAATLVWFMMIAGFAVTAGVAGHFLDPYSPERLLVVTASVSVIAMTVTVLALRGLESTRQADARPKSKVDFREALAEVWQEPSARRFTVFVFISMLAYSFQDLILEPFAGLVFGMSPGESTQLAGIQHGGVLAGMIAVAASGSFNQGGSGRLLRFWTVGGCGASAIALLGLAWGGQQPNDWGLTTNVFVLGFFNGAFAVAAIASMMLLASSGGDNREGLKMGLWGAAQAIAFATGGFLGTVAVDICSQWLEQPSDIYGLVFMLEAGLFVVAAMLGRHIQRAQSTQRGPSMGAVAVNQVFEGGA